MKFVMTQAVCPEGMQLLDGIADVYVADNQDPNNYLDEMRDAAALIVRIAKCDASYRKQPEAQGNWAYRRRI